MNQPKSTQVMECVSHEKKFSGLTNGLFSFDQIWTLITRVGAAAHKYGATTMTVESYIRSCFDAFGYAGNVKCTPNTLWISLTDAGSKNTREDSISIQNDVDLNKLAKLGDVVSKIRTADIGFEEAIKEIEQVDAAKPTWGPFSILLSYIAVAIGLPGLIGGNWLDTLIGPFISIIVYLIVFSSTQWKPLFQPLLPLIASFVAGGLTAVSYFLVPQLNVVLVILSATAIILPGYSVSLGIGELVAGKWRSGVINLSNGLICMAKMVVGSMLGLKLVSLFLALPIAPESITAIDSSWFFILFPILMLGLIIVFQTPKKDMFWVLLASTATFSAFLGVAEFAPKFVAAFVSSAIAAVIASEWSIRTKRPSLIVLIPIIVLLVSGTIGFRGLVNIVGGDIALGFEQFSETITVAIFMMLGLMAGHLVKKNPNYI